jgi:orotidine-5'-phosphate decarboxylase
VNSMKHDSKIVVALDFDDMNKALTFADSVDPKLCRLKVGKEMFTHFGPQYVKELHKRNFEVFLDLKFHDIPNTVAKAVSAAADLGVWMVNVHASGGPVMMSKAKDALEKYGHAAPLLIAVTVLTSMDQAQLNAIGINTTPMEHVLRLAKLTQSCGLDGVVCSAQEATLLRSELDCDFKLITPGIRPTFSATDDQIRVMTPEQAIKAGVDYLVIGRPITQAKNSLETLQEISDSIRAVLK